MASGECAAERGLRYALVTVFIVGVRQRNPGAVVNAVLAAIGTYASDVVERRYDIKLQAWHHLYIDTAMVTHAVGMLGPYDEVRWWDHLTHTHSATILGGAVFAISRRRGRDPRPRVIAVVACVGVLWEIAEYAIHASADRLGVEPILVTYGRTDTALDLLFDLVGALLVLALGDRVLGDLATADATDTHR